MISVLFCVCEDAKVWAHWNYSLDMHLNYLGLVSCLFDSILNSPLGSQCGGVGVWGSRLDGDDGQHSQPTGVAGNIFCLHCHNNNNEHRLGGYTTKLGFSHFWSLENPRSRYQQIWCLVKALSIGCSQPLSPCIFLRSSLVSIHGQTPWPLSLSL